MLIKDLFQVYTNMMQQDRIITLSDSEEWHRRVSWGHRLHEVRTLSYNSCRICKSQSTFLHIQAEGYNIPDTIKHVLENNEVPREDVRPVVRSVRERSNLELEKLQRKQEGILEQRSTLESEIQTLQDRLASQIQTLQERIATQIQALKDDAEAQTLVLQSQIDALQSEHDTLKADSAARQKEILACDVALSPARGLPLDILQEVALWALPEEPTGSLTEVPRNFSMVSRSWRKAVLSMPRLWSTLFVQTGQTLITRWRRNPIRRAQKLLTNFATNASPHHLTIHISLICQRKQHIPETTESVYNFLAWVLYEWPSISSVRRLTISSVYAWKEILISNGSLSLPCLEALVFTTRNGQQEIPGDETISIWMEEILGDAPRLREITLGCGILDTPQECLPLTRLEYLALEDPISASTFIDVLDACTELRSGYFNICDTHDLEPRQGPVQDRCLNLQDLYIRIFDHESESVSLGILQHHRLPSLSRLALRFTGPNDAYRPPTSVILQDPVDLSSYLPKFRELALYDSWEWPVNILDFLDNNSAITSVELGVFQSDLRQVASLFTISEDVALLPRLSTFKMQVSTTYGEVLPKEDCDALYTLHRSRMGPNNTGVVQLEIFELKSEKIVGEVEARLQEMKEKLAQVGVNMLYHNEVVNRHPKPKGIVDDYKGGPDALGYFR